MLKGVVVKVIDDRTVIVSVNRAFTHKVYKKIVRTKKDYICDCQKDVVIGDTVLIKQSRKISKMKSYIVI